MPGMAKRWHHANVAWLAEQAQNTGGIAAPTTPANRRCNGENNSAAMYNTV